MARNIQSPTIAPPCVETETQRLYPMPKAPANSARLLNRESRKLVSHAYVDLHVDIWSDLNPPPPNISPIICERKQYEKRDRTKKRKLSIPILDMTT